MDNEITHCVILNVDPDSAYGVFFEHMATRISSPKGTSVLCIWASSVDASHLVYLDFVAHKRTGQELYSPGMKTRIPHSLVLMIGDPSLVKERIGFHWE